MCSKDECRYILVCVCIYTYMYKCRLWLCTCQNANVCMYVCADKTERLLLYRDLDYKKYRFGLHVQTKNRELYCTNRDLDCTNSRHLDCTKKKDLDCIETWIVKNTGLDCMCKQERET